MGAGRQSANQEARTNATSWQQEFSGRSVNLPVRATSCSKRTAVEVIGEDLEANLSARRTLGCSASGT
jgi:hypothetical protein